MSQKLKSSKYLWQRLGVITLILIGLGLVLMPLPVTARTLGADRPVVPGTEPVMAVAAPPASPLLIQTSSAISIYLPLLMRNPQPLFWDTFSSDKTGWPVGKDDKCTSSYEGGRFRLDVVKDKECFRFAPPDDAERVFGTFEVSVYHSEGQTSDALFGLYFNGDGGDKQYIFRIRPNVSTGTCSSGGQWEFRRRWVESDGDKRDDLIHRACEPLLRRGYGGTAINTIRAKHTNTGLIHLYINNKQVVIFNENSDSAPELKGKGVGIYAGAPSNQDIVIKYDDFKVYSLADSP